MIIVALRRFFHLLFYAIFQFGKSKEDIYSAFRQTILGKKHSLLQVFSDYMHCNNFSNTCIFVYTIIDIERLLLMRDNPPPPPAVLEWGSSKPVSSDTAEEATNNQSNHNSQTLSAEDLGMLLLHIHECRNILWQSRRRFRSDVLRNVAEDLAELAGERGPVSVSQQLQIITRMSRTYPFMKVMSSSVPFEMIIPGTG